MAAAESSWDPQMQVRELNEWRRHQASGLVLLGVGLVIVGALLAFEVLSINEDRDTFFVVGGLNLLIVISWMYLARRAAARSAVLGLMAKRIEVEVLKIPRDLSVGAATAEGAEPTLLATGAVLLGFAVLWAGLVAYSFWWAFLPH